MKQLIAPSPEAGPQFASWGLLLNPFNDGVPGKTGGYDDSLIIDSDPWLGEFLKILVAGRHPEDFLWPVKGSELIALFQGACNALGLQALAPCRYALRHGGASEDIASGRRSLDAVKKRGHWRSDTSLRRYVKETRLQAEVHKISRGALEYGRRALDTLESLFRTGATAFPPPLAGV